MNPTNLKSSRIINNDPWAVLVALASLIILATGIAIIVICLLWKKYRKSRILFESNLNGLSGVAFEMPHTTSVHNLTENRPKEYEVQSLDMYVPQDDRDDLGEVHVGFTPREGIKHVHHVKEMQLMQNQLPDNKNSQSIYNGLDFNLPMNLDKLNLKESSLYRRVMHYTNLYNKNTKN